MRAEASLKTDMLEYSEFRKGWIKLKEGKRYWNDLLCIVDNPLYGFIIDRVS